MSDYEGEASSYTNEIIQYKSAEPPPAYAEKPTPIDLLHDNAPVPHYLTPKNELKLVKPRSTRNFEPLLQRVQPRAHHGTGGRSIDKLAETMPALSENKAYQRFIAQPNKPNDTYQLDVPWKQFLRAIPEASHAKAAKIARNHLDNIGIYSEVFLKTPKPDSTVVELWGGKEQCQMAKTRLHTLERQLRRPVGQSSYSAWKRQNAYDNGMQQLTWQALENVALQEINDQFFEWEAYLIWPSEQDLNAYISKYESSTLDEISMEFRCRIKHERAERSSQTGNILRTKILATTEGDLLSVYQRLINLVKEMVAQNNRGTHGNFCRLPSPEAYRDTVDVEMVKPALPTDYRILLLGNLISPNEVVNWLAAQKTYEKQNQEELRASTDAFIQNLHLSECHVRMRLSFGDLLLREFPRAKNGSMTYGFEEFMSLLQGKRTLMSDPILQTSHGDLSLLADKLSALPQFEHLKDSYKQTFDFKGTDITNRLRLEIELRPGFDFEEPEMCSQRWLTFKTHGQNENILGLRVLDFEKPGYMLRVDSWNLFTNEAAVRDMDWFSTAIRYRPSRDGIKAYPKMKSTFPHHGKLISVVETVASRFQFKDTDGIVEVLREELFMQDNGVPSRMPNSTKFEVHYYYPEWDNLLGEFSTIRPGEATTWQHDIQTLFPDNMNPDYPCALPHGFKKFMEEVHEIQDLLAQMLSC